MNRFRLGLALGGFVAALAAVITNDWRIASIAIGLLSGSFLLRLLQRRPPREHSEDKPDTL